MTNLVVALVRRTRAVAARAMSLGRIATGDDFIVGPRLRVGKGRKLTVGDRVSIGSDFHCMSNVVMGSDIMVSSSVAIVGDDHAFDDPRLTIQQQPRNPHSTVVIEGDNLIGYGTLIVGNVTIGRGAIVGAGSLVTRDLPEAAVYAGRPARMIRPRYT